MTIAVSPDGASVYLFSSFTDSVDLGDGMVVTETGEHLFIAEFAGADGAPIRIAHSPVTDEVHPLGLAVTADGLVATGELQGTGSFDGTTLRDGFLLRYDRELNLLAAEDVDGATFDAVSVRPEGGYVLSGFADGVVDLGCGPHGAAGERTSVVAAFDSSGACLWDYGPVGYEMDDVVATAGATYVVGSFSSPVDFGDGMPVTPAGSDGAVVALGSMGAHDWHRTLEGAASVFSGIGAMSDGPVVVGTFSGEVIIGSSTLTSTSDSGVIVDFSPTGSIRLARTFSAGGFSRATDVAVGRGNNTVVIA